MLGGVNNFRERRPIKPRIHAGADEYFRRKPQTQGAISPNARMGKRETGKRNLGGSGWLVYLYWFLGGLAAIALIYFIGNFLRTAGVSAKLVFQEGEVLVKRGPEGEWKKVDTDTKLKKLDEIKTEAGGRAIINFEDGTIIRVDEYSRIILSGEKGKITVIQTDGTSYHRVAKSEKQEYEVEFTGIEGMPETKVQSLGTAFWVKKTGAELSVGVLESKVKFIREGTTVELEEGQKVLANEEGEEKKEIEGEDLKSYFIAWNLDQDEKKELSVSSFVRLKLAQEEERAEEEQAEENQESEEENVEKGIVLAGTASDQGVTLNWELKGLEAPNGFKVVKGVNENPEYPGSYYRSVRSDTARSYVWDVGDGKVHHFRVCIYDGSSKCEVYSNDFEIEAKKVESGEERENCRNSGGEWDSGAEKCNCPTNKELKDGKCVSKDSEGNKADCEDSGGTWDSDDEECSCPSGETLEDSRCVKENYADSVSLNGSNKDKKTANLSWSISGGNAPKGYKIVKSKSKNPSYPDDDHKSISSGSTKSYKWDGLKKGETYYFRVCVWDGDKCVTYSNSDRVIVDK